MIAVHISEALSIFEIGSLDGQDKLSVKKLYRAKMKANHPDIAGEQSNTKAQQLNEAYMVLDKAVASIESLKHTVSNKSTGGFYVIQLSDLQKIYAGQPVKAVNANTFVDNSVLRQNRIALMTSITVKFRDTVTTTSEFISWSISDSYNVSVSIKDHFIDTNGKLDITVCGETKSIEVGNNRRLNFLFKFGYNVQLSVLLERCEADGQRDSTSCGSRLQR